MMRRMKVQLLLPLLALSSYFTARVALGDATVWNCSDVVPLGAQCAECHLNATGDWEKCPEQEGSTATEFYTSEDDYDTVVDVRSCPGESMVYGSEWECASNGELIDADQCSNIQYSTVILRSPHPGGCP